MVNHTLFALERHVDDTIERIASERAAAAGLASAPRATARIDAARRRVGAILITLGERVGGPAVRAPRQPASLSTHTPMFGF